MERKRRRISLPLTVAALLLGVAVSPTAGAPQPAAASSVPPIDAPTLKTNPSGDPYLIGAISWPGFVEGVHWGWRRLEPYSDRKPLLGYYDEDSVEVWDWHIKFAKEHGISYFGFVWNRGKDAGEPVTYPHLSHGMEAFKQSQFSNQMKYTLIWGGLHSTGGATEFENNVWPELKQEFTHPSYLVIDNKPVIYKLDPTGSIADPSGVFDRMRQLAIAEGFSGVTVITARKKEAYSDYGFIYGGAMHDAGGDISPEQDAIAEDFLLDRFGGAQTGTMTVGYDPDPWAHKQFHGIPGQMFEQRAWRFTPPGYQNMAQSFRAKMDGESGLTSELALAGAWNEWGEGHFIAPSEEYGYDYLEGIRNAFTLADNIPYHGDPLAESFGPYDLGFSRDAAHYELDQSSGVTATDSSGWDRHADLLGSPTWRPGQGHDGSGALELDGSNDVVRLATVQLGGGPEFMHDYVGTRTVSMWVKATTTSGTRVLFDQGGVAYGMALRIKDGDLEGAVSKQPDIDLLSAAYPSDGAWHHVAFTYQAKDEDGTKDWYERLYLDGTLVDEDRHVDDPVWRIIRSQEDAAGLGARVGGDAFGDSPTGGYFQGLIDDVRIVPKELRPDEIAGIAGKIVGIVDSKSGGISYKAKGIVEGNPQPLYWWKENVDAGDHGGSVKLTGIAGNDAVYTFEGSTIWYIARKGVNQAKVEVFVDEISQGVFDLYAPTIQNQQVIFSKALPAGKHTIRIEHTGTKNPASQGNLINVDYLKYDH